MLIQHVFDHSLPRQSGYVFRSLGILGAQRAMGMRTAHLTSPRLKATFFVETLHVGHFGDAPMGAVVERILAGGHDVQFHLHPQWLALRDPAWRDRAAPPDDNCEGRSEAELCDMIGEGSATFRRWGAPAPVALRTGGLRTDRTVYRAMERMGLRLASNVGWGLFEPAEAELRVAAGRVWIGKVLEVPVATYRQVPFGPLRPLRLCTITSTSRAEQRWLLDRAAREAASPFVILTHPFEFVRYFGKPGPVATSRVNLARLEALCALLETDPRFRTVTFAEAAGDWANLPPARFPPRRVPTLASAARVVENALDRLRLRH